MFDGGKWWQTFIYQCAAIFTWCLSHWWLPNSEWIFFLPIVCYLYEDFDAENTALLSDNGQICMMLSWRRTHSILAKDPSCNVLIHSVQSFFIAFKATCCPFHAYMYCIVLGEKFTIAVIRLCLLKLCFVRLSIDEECSIQLQYQELCHCMRQKNGKRFIYVTKLMVSKLKTELEWTSSYTKSIDKKRTKNFSHWSFRMKILAIWWMSAFRSNINHLLKIIIIFGHKFSYVRWLHTFPVLTFCWAKAYLFDICSNHHTSDIAKIPKTCCSYFSNVFWR